MRVGFCDPSEGLWLFVLGPGVGSVLGGVSGAAAGFFSRAGAPRETLGAHRRRGRAGARGAAARHRREPRPLLHEPDGVRVRPVLRRLCGTPLRHGGERRGPPGDVPAGHGAHAPCRRARRVPLRSFARTRPRSRAARTSGPRRSRRSRRSSVALWHSASGPASRPLEHERFDRRGARGTPLRQTLRRRLRPGAPAAGRAALHPRLRRVARERRGATSARVARSACGSSCSGATARRAGSWGLRTRTSPSPGAARCTCRPRRFRTPCSSTSSRTSSRAASRAGRFASPGTLGGLWPDPGRIEGFAVAAAIDDDDELTPEEWAASMLKLGLLPRALAACSSSASWGSTPPRRTPWPARSSAGCARPTARPRSGAGTPASASNRSRTARISTALERDFRAALARTKVPERALATAQARFEKPSFFARRCPRIVDRALGEATQRLEAGDVKGARDGFAEALRLDPGNVEARFGARGLRAPRGRARRGARASPRAHASRRRTEGAARPRARNGRGHRALARPRGLRPKRCTTPPKSSSFPRIGSAPCT